MREWSGSCGGDPKTAVVLVKETAVCEESLLSVIPEVTDNNNNLTHQRDPERYRRERTVLESISDIPQGEVREHQLSRDGCSGHNDNDGAQHLGEGQGGDTRGFGEGLYPNRHPGWHRGLPTRATREH